MPDILVIDNASTGDQFLILSSCENARTTIWQNSNNLGFAAGVNMGIKASYDAGYEYCWILNNDCIVEQHCLKRLLAAADAQEAALLFGCVSITPDDNAVHTSGGGWLRRYSYTSKLSREPSSTGLDYISGVSMLVRVEQLVNEVGLFDPLFFMYWEDVDLGLRVKKAKYEVACVDDAVVWHGLSKSLGRERSGRRSYRFEQFFYTSHGSFIRKHAPFSLIFVCGNVFARLVLYTLRGDYKAAKVAAMSLLTGYLK